MASNATIKITQEEKEMFDYLNRLRESGETNMFGATPYLAKQFKIDRELASKTLSKWMGIFNENGYDHLL